jgi:hypothetical protein
MVGQRKAIAILGMFFAVLGGIVWFLQQNSIAIILWGIAALILFKLNKRNRKNIRRRKNNNYR